ncbi:hypothetical protein [uncultured Xanthomonas sp.]|uniref:hypothetical protein n=1 Tax=uncultured Xanthomonas sp. TaxID=152831 RepID=UPI0012658FFA|nr:hypothetical protein [uncultured Xanthomonas sp.]
MFLLLLLFLLLPLFLLSLLLSIPREGWRTRRVKPREGRRAGCASFSAGTWMCLPKIPVVSEDPARSAGQPARGCVSFGYFSLHKQRKVTRASARKLLPLKLLLLKKRFHIPGNAPSRLKPLLQVHIS